MDSNDDLSMNAYILGDTYYKKYIQTIYSNDNKSIFEWFSSNDIYKELKEIREIILNINEFENDGI